MDKLNDYSCSICLGLYYKPINTKCGHTFCQLCVVDMADFSLNINCPLCREKLKNVNTLKVDAKKE